MTDSPLERNVASGHVRINPQTGHPYDITSWSFIDLTAAKAGEVPAPQHWTRTDSVPLLYVGKHHAFVGPSESLKSWAALAACRDVFQQGGRALYVDFEDSELTFVERARVAGIPDGALGSSVRYMRPDQPASTPEAIADLQMAMVDFAPHLVILDGVTEAFSLQKWSTNSAEDTASWQQLVRAVFRSGGATTVEIDHTGKDTERGALGSQHKRAGIDGAQYTFAIGSVPDRDRAGFAHVKVGKDRYGHVQRHAQGKNRDIGTLYVDPQGGVRIDPPTSAADKAVELRAQVAGELGMRGALSTNKLYEALGGRKDELVTALRAMEADGSVNCSAGPRGADVWDLA